MNCRKYKIKFDSVKVILFCWNPGITWVTLCLLDFIFHTNMYFYYFSWFGCTLHLCVVENRRRRISILLTQRLTVKLLIWLKLFTWFVGSGLLCISFIFFSMFLFFFTIHYQHANKGFCFKVWLKQSVLLWSYKDPQCDSAWEDQLKKQPTFFTCLRMKHWLFHFLRCLSF